MQLLCLIMIARIFNVKFDQDNSHHEFKVKNHTSTPKSKKVLDPNFERSNKNNCCMLIYSLLVKT